MSLIEILISMTIVALLSVVAYLQYQGFVEQARHMSTVNRLDAIRKAMEAWRGDHQGDYPTRDLQPLLGRYLPSDEDDGWGFDFIIDPYFLRVISRGPNARLDTFAPGHPETPTVDAFTDDPFPGPTRQDKLANAIAGSDDLVAGIANMGRLVIVGTSARVVMNPDGARRAGLPGNAGADQAPGGGLLVYASGPNLWRDWIDEQGSIGEFDLKTQEAVPPTRISTWIVGTAGNNWGTVAIAPDGYHMAALQPAPGGFALVVGEIVSAGEGQGAASHTVTTFPALLGGAMAHLSWDRTSSRLFTNDPSGAVIAIYSSAGSQPQIPTWGSLATHGTGTWNPDFCPTRDRLAFVRDGATQVANAITGAVLKQHQVSSPSDDKFVAWSRTGDALAVVGDDGSLRIWWPDRTLGDGNPFRVGGGLLPSLTPVVGTVTHLRWR